jgi:hypothetical protein
MNLVSPKDPLNAQQKEALRLREHEHLTYREIAARMGVSPHRIQQVLATARARLEDCAAHGEAALSLLPKRVRNLLECVGLASPAALRAAITSKRLVWDVSRVRLMLDGKSLRNVGWHSWQVMCEWAGLPRPEPPPVRDMRRFSYQAKPSASARKTASRAQKA